MAMISRNETFSLYYPVRILIRIISSFTYASYLSRFHLNEMVLKTSDLLLPSCFRCFTFCKRRYFQHNVNEDRVDYIVVSDLLRSDLAVVNFPVEQK